MKNGEPMNCTSPGCKNQVVEGHSSRCAMHIWAGPQIQFKIEVDKEGEIVSIESFTVPPESERGEGT